MTFSNIFQAIKSFVLKSRPAYKDYVGETTSETLYNEFMWIEDDSLYDCKNEPTSLIIGDTYRIEFTDQNGNTSECTSVANACTFLDVPVRFLTLRNGDKTAYFIEDYNCFITDDLTINDLPDAMYRIADNIVVHHVITTKKYDIKKLPEECVPDSVTKKIAEAKSTAETAQSTAETAQSTAETAQSTAETAQSTAETAKSTAETAKSTAETALYNGTKLKNVGTIDATLYGNVSINTDGTYYARVGNDGCGLYKYVAYNSSDEKIFEVCLLSNKVLKTETVDIDIINTNYTLRQTLLNYQTYVPSLISSTTYRMIFNVYRYENAGGESGMSFEFNKHSDIAHMAIYYGSYDPAKKLQFGAQTMADSTTLGLIRAPEALETDTTPVRIKSSEGTLWVERASSSTPDWDQNNSSASDYIKNRPCYASKTPNWNIIKQGTIGSAPSYEYISGGSYPPLYEQAMSFMGSVKGEFSITIHNSDYSSVYDEKLTVVRDNTSAGEREYATSDEKITVRRTVTELNSTITFGDSSFAGQSYTLRFNVPALAYHPLDDGYIPDTVQRVGDDVIIPSSTSGSTKKFKITVDDSGTISASEVTT